MLTSLRGLRVDGGVVRYRSHPSDFPKYRAATQLPYRAYGPGGAVVDNCDFECRRLQSGLELIEATDLCDRLFEQFPLSCRLFICSL